MLLVFLNLLGILVSYMLAPFVLWFPQIGFSFVLAPGVCGVGWGRRRRTFLGFASSALLMLPFFPVSVYIVGVLAHSLRGWVICVWALRGGLPPR